MNRRSLADPGPRTQGTLQRDRSSRSALFVLLRVLGVQTLLFHTLFICLSHFELFPFLGTKSMVSRDRIISLRYMPLQRHLANWFSTPATRQVLSNKLSRLLRSLAFSRCSPGKKILQYEEKSQRIGSRTPVLSVLLVTAGRLHHCGASAL